MKLSLTSILKESGLGDDGTQSEIYHLRQSIAKSIAMVKKSIAIANELSGDHHQIERIMEDTMSFLNEIRPLYKKYKNALSPEDRANFEKAYRTFMTMGNTSIV